MSQFFKQVFFEDIKSVSKHKNIFILRRIKLEKERATILFFLFRKERGHERIWKRSKERKKDKTDKKKDKIKQNLWNK